MKSVVVRVANCEGVSERRPQDEARLALTKPGVHGLPDIVLLSEVSWLDAMDLKLVGWHFTQYGVRGSAEAGVAIASRVKPTKGWQTIGSRAVAGVRMRPLTSVRVDGIRFTAAHAPPARNPVARFLYIARARTCLGIIGGDWNRDVAWMKLHSQRRYRGIGVLGLLVPRRFKATGSSAVDIGSDHPAVDVKVTRRA